MWRPRQGEMYFCQLSAILYAKNANFLTSLSALYLPLEPGEPVPADHPPRGDPEEYEAHCEGDLPHGPLLLPDGQPALHPGDRELRLHHG